MAVSNPLHKWFPDATPPIIISAPMFTVSNGKLAAEVSKAGGIGMVPAGLDPRPESPHLAALDQHLSLAREILGQTDEPETPLRRLGVGFITLLGTPDIYRVSAVPLLRKHRPAIVWLFGSSDPHQDYAPLVRLFADAGREWGLRVLVQVGSVDAARVVVQAGADGIVAQGSDAGGHQFARAAGIVSLVPEVRDMLRDEFADREVALVAAGGIVDGRGVAAALALGADGVSMGTRFIPAPESDAEPYVRKAVLNTQDGGVNTTRSSMHDSIQGYPTWSDAYTGRAVTHQGIVDLENGVPFEDVAKSWAHASVSGDESKLVTFA